MTIKARSSGYQVDVQVKGKRLRAQAPNKEAAIALEAQLRADLLQGRVPDIIQKRNFKVAPVLSGDTLGYLFDACYARYWCASQHKAGVMSVAKAILLSLGQDTLVSDITTATINDYIIKMKAEGLAPATINKRLAMISKMFSHAEKTGVIPKGTKPDIEFMKVKTTRTRFFTEEERSAILNYYKDTKPQWASFFTVLIETGVRCSEARRIKMEDINGTTLTIWQTKADLPRSIPLTKMALEAIRSISSNQPFLFATGNRIEDRWNEIKAHLGLSHDHEFVPHACRHDCATRLLKKTKNIKLVQQWLGHKDVKETMRYAHLIPTELEDARDLLEAA